MLELFYMYFLLFVAWVVSASILRWVLDWITNDRYSEITTPDYSLRICQFIIAFIIGISFLYYF